jgi:hypothetical protein
MFELDRLMAATNVPIQRAGVVSFHIVFAGQFRGEHGK